MASPIFSVHGNNAHLVPLIPIIRAHYPGAQFLVRRNDRRSPSHRLVVVDDDHSADVAERKLTADDERPLDVVVVDPRFESLVSHNGPNRRVCMGVDGYRQALAA